MPLASNDPKITGSKYESVINVDHDLGLKLNPTDHAAPELRKLMWLELELSEEELTKLHEYLKEGSDKEVSRPDLLLFSELRIYLQAVRELYAIKIQNINSSANGQKKGRIDKAAKAAHFHKYFPTKGDEVAIAEKDLTLGTLVFLTEIRGCRSAEAMGYER